MKSCAGECETGARGRGFSVALAAYRGRHRNCLFEGANTSLVLEYDGALSSSAVSVFRTGIVFDGTQACHLVNRNHELLWALFLDCGPILICEWIWVQVLDPF